MSGDAYIAAIDYTDSFFAIGRNDSFFDFIAVLAIDFSVTIDPNATHIIQFWMEGSSLTARLLDASTGQQLSILTATDASYASGSTGIFVETSYDAFDNPTGPIVGTFDQIEAPEPGFAALLGAGVCLLTRLSTRRRPGSAAA